MCLPLLDGVSHSPRILKPQEDDCYGPKSVPPLPPVLPKEGLQSIRGSCPRHSTLTLLDSSTVQDVSLAALYVSTKMHDTLKKPKDILTASYAVRFPEKALKSKTLVREVDVDPQVSQLFALLDLI